MSELIGGRYYLIRVVSNSEITVGEYASDWLTESGGAFWICGSDDPYTLKEVEVLKEIDASLPE